MSQPRLLDLFCGAGGAGKGYHDAGFDVTGVDIVAQPRYPYRFIQADALEYLGEHGHEYDAIHASPPCQGYCWLTPAKAKARHPKLIGITRDALLRVDRPFVIENVEDARHFMRNPLRLCGTMFGLPLWRHRRFETSFSVCQMLPPCQHDGWPILVSGTPRRKGIPRKDATAAEKRMALCINWMTTEEMDDAIPPAYTRWIGLQLLDHLQ